MTAETDLLPCPFCDGNAKLTTRKDESLWSHEIVDWQTVECVGCGVETERTCDGFERTAADVWNTRANLAELQREVEGLRAEVAGLTAQVEHHTAYTVIHRGALRYCNSTMRDAYSDEHHRAERLAGALREAREYVVSELAGERAKFAGYEHCSTIASIEADIAKIDAALDQETTNG